MPHFEHADILSASPTAVFRFLMRLANLVRLAPPEWQMQRVDGPDMLTAGASFTLRARRRGLTQTMTYEVTEIEPERRLVLVQTRGPFRQWRQTQELEPLPNGGTLLRERIEWERPGGILGLFATDAVIEKELQELYAWRGGQLPALLIADPEAL
jgi:ligand-binding SRPBCC domain-containing protein